MADNRGISERPLAQLLYDGGQKGHLRKGSGVAPAPAAQARAGAEPRKFFDVLWIIYMKIPFHVSKNS